MKTTNIGIGTFIIAWRIYAYVKNGGRCNHKVYDQFSEALKRYVLPHKFYAAVYDENENLYFAIFDTELERLDWLSKWYDENPNDEDSGTAKYKDFKNHACSDIESVCAYSMLSGTNGVLFAL
ncbi:MAG: hypothetical protein NC299_16975 [Lachnospiraceae bacterium]|nr:hypothetical protein [Ruminococcus sp.]MCM1277025.1 hypothetical protein [Lachnospiraceae bacterium]